MSAIEIPSDVPKEELVPAIIAALKDRPDLQELLPALIVRLANMQERTTVYGHEVVDTLPDADPKANKQNIYPYAQIKGGSLGTVIAKDANGVPHILLGAKHVPQTTIRTENDGLDNLWTPGGFMAPRPPHNPQAKDTDTPVNFDENLEDTMIRTLKANTGLEVCKSKLQFVGQHMDDIKVNISGVEGVPYQQQLNSYLIDLTQPDGKLPEANASGAFQSFSWVPLNEITVNGDSFKYNGNEIMPIYRETTIEPAIALYRKNEFEKHGITREAMAFAIAGKPETELGAEAANWHKKALEIAAEAEVNSREAILSAKLKVGRNNVQRI